MTPPDETDFGDQHPSLDNNDASSAALSSNLIGRNLDEYHILRRLGRGGMADVYVAFHQTLERQVALKVLRRELARDAGYVERFRREARAAAKLNHPNIVHVYQVGRADEYHYIAQELIDGGNLKDEVERTGPLSPDAAAVVMRSVCEALGAAHRAGITHRDIKPENILRSLRGEVKVADFGLARVGSGNDLTQVGLTMGTPRYMSPEQVQGKPADSRSDLYSLGCTMYFLLTGRPPFEADDALAIALQHLHETPKPLATARGRGDIPGWMEAIVSRLMAKAATDRFADVEQVIAAMEADGTPVVPLQSVAGTAAATVLLQQAMRAESAKRRTRRMKWAVIALLPVVAFVAGFAFQSRRKAPSISRLLTPDLVPRKPSVEEQYLSAASRDDVPAWRAISEYFPASESAKNAAYCVKADIQLARLLHRTSRTEEALPILERIADDASTDKLYHVIAIAELLEMNAIDSAKALSLRERLRQSYRALVDHQPEMVRLLPQILKPETFQRLESS